MNRSKVEPDTGLGRIVNRPSEGGTVCHCSRAPGVISAIFASLAVLALIAQDGCLEGGGRVSDVAWVCEAASGAGVNFWSLVSPFAVGLVAVGVGIPVYLVVHAIVRRLGTVSK